jgi:two-component system, OmpR family, KDP operon response regulator KdpE
VEVSAKSRPRVLLVDDDQRILNFLRVKLTMSGYEVTTATTGERAVDLFESRKPDIIVMDVLMPGISGLEVLRGLRVFSDVPIIVISASTDNAERAMSLGASSFMSKPLDPDELVKRIEGALDHGR